MPRCQAGVRSQRARSVTPTDVCACVCLCAPGNKVLAQVATNLIEDSYFGLTCLRFPPIVVAASAVYMAQLVVDCLPGVGQTVPTLPTELVRVVSPHAACACPLTAMPASYLQPIGKATRDSSFAGVMHSHMDAVQGVWLLASRHRQQWWRGCTLLGTPCPHRVPRCLSPPSHAAPPQSAAAACCSCWTGDSRSCRCRWQWHRLPHHDRKALQRRRHSPVRHCAGRHSLWLGPRPPAACCRSPAHQPAAPCRHTAVAPRRPLLLGVTSRRPPLRLPPHPRRPPRRQTPSRRRSLARGRVPRLLRSPRPVARPRVIALTDVRGARTVAVIDAAAGAATAAAAATATSGETTAGNPAEPRLPAAAAPAAAAAPSPDLGRPAAVVAPPAAPAARTDRIGRVARRLARRSRLAGVAAAPVAAAAAAAAAVAALCVAEHAPEESGHAAVVDPRAAPAAAPAGVDGAAVAAAGARAVVGADDQGAAPAPVAAGEGPSGVGATGAGTVPAPAAAEAAAEAHAGHDVASAAPAATIATAGPRPSALDGLLEPLASKPRRLELRQRSWQQQQRIASRPCPQPRRCRRPLDQRWQRRLWHSPLQVRRRPRRCRSTYRSRRLPCHHNPGRGGGDSVAPGRVLSHALCIVIYVHEVA